MGWIKPGNACRQRQWCWQTLAWHMYGPQRLLRVRRSSRSSAGIQPLAVPIAQSVKCPLIRWASGLASTPSSGLSRSILESSEHPNIQALVVGPNNAPRPVRGSKSISRYTVTLGQGQGFFRASAFCSRRCTSTSDPSRRCNSARCHRPSWSRSRLTA